MLIALVASAPATPRHRHRPRPHEGPRFFDPDTFDPFFETPPPNGLPPGSEPESIPPFVPERSPSPGPLPFPQGFVLDVPVRPRDADDQDQAPERPSTPLTRYRQVADALASCWDPPAHFDDKPWGQVTLRVSFKRDGSINGTPRIPYVDQGLTPAARSGLTQSLDAALGRCVPLPFSPSLGSAIAGQIFALRFIEQDTDR